MNDKGREQGWRATKKYWQDIEGVDRNLRQTGTKANRSASADRALILISNCFCAC